VSELLGTPLFAAGEDAVTFLVSDLHVRADGGPVVANLGGVLRAAAAAGGRVFVLGDLFDSYVARGQVRTGVWRDVAAMFAAATAAGTEVVLLHGNRDFLLGPEFAAASGVRIVAGGLRGPLAGIDTVLVHGDELCQNDLPYQRAKRWLRHPWTRGLARRLPLRVAVAVAGPAPAPTPRVVQSGDQRRFLPTTAAVTAAFATGARRLVFGHIHRFAHGQQVGGEYWVLPAFDEAAIGLVTRGDTLVPMRFDAAGRGADVPLPGPCPLSP
jgi:UDP-2,3-diacylglucosamine hydrolase